MPGAGRARECREAGAVLGVDPGPALQRQTDAGNVAGVDGLEYFVTGDLPVDVLPLTHAGRDDDRHQAECAQRVAQSLSGRRSFHNAPVRRVETSTRPPPDRSIPLPGEADAGLPGRRIATPYAYFAAGGSRAGRRRRSR